MPTTDLENPMISFELVWKTKIALKLLATKIGAVVRKNTSSAHLLRR